ncbi:MAG: glycosyltransferase, partial [Actinobacteria bacterium]|nr:glycosyltransferase [Actinomycetota bacterium]
MLTYRRIPQLAALLRALGNLRFSRISPPAVRVVVVDNSPEGDARKTVSAAGPDRVLYVHLGAGNIAAGRNAVLDHARGADFLAFLDDDELPERDWLEELMIVQSATGADIVVGPVRPRLPEPVPDWFRDGNFFDLD